MFGAKRPTYHGYAAATRMRPEWVTGFLVFQGGVPRTRGNSLTGGGQIYSHEFQGPQTPVMHGYAPGVNSVVGGGQMLAYPAYLAPLYGGKRGMGS